MTTIEATKHLIASLQAAKLNGTSPADCGEYADIMGEAVRAFEQGGVSAAMKVIATVPELLRLAAGGGGAESPVIWPQYNLSEGLKLPDTSYLVYGAIGEGDIGMIYGDAAAGKTYLSIDLAVCLAAGLPWMGQWAISKPRRVLYFIAEGRKKFFRRILATVNGLADRGFNVADVYRLVDQNLTICTEVPQLFAADAKHAAANYLEFWQQQGSPPVDIMFIDTLHRASVGGDENNSKDAGIVIDTITLMQQVIGCAAVFVHHSNKAGGYRGSSAYRGNVDFVFKVEGLHREARKLTIDKMRDGEQDGPADGSEYTAIFMVDNASGGTYTTWLEGETGDKRQSAREAAKDEIRRLIAEGVNTQNAIAAGVKAVSQNIARQILAAMVTDGELFTVTGARNSIKYELCGYDCTKLV